MDERSYALLLVEDNPGDADLMQERLRQGEGAQFRVRHVETLADARSALAEHPFDLVLLDLSLPDSFGPETFHQLHSAHPDLPVIVLTGLDDEEIGASLVRLGAQDYLVKWQVTGTLLARCVRYSIERSAIEQSLREARIEAVEASSAKSDFLAGMSHEIRTPLNSILGMADLLHETQLSDEQQKYVDVFQKAGETLLRLINGILDLSKIEAGKLELMKADFDLPKLVKDTLDIVSFPAESKGLRIQAQVDPRVPRYVNGDAPRVQEVLINLIGNAIKFTDQGEVIVQVAPDPERGDDHAIRFSICDTGVGIGEEYRERIFERFDQGDRNVAQAQGGTGLGLSLSLGLAQRMDGRIWVESAVGEGSTFHFLACFGEADADAISSELEAQPQANDGPVPAMRILLVDDSEDNRLLALAFLRDTPHCVEVAETGEQAVEMFRADDYDLVLMDVQMPGIDGYEATRQIRQHEQAEGQAATPVVALTAFAFDEDRGKSLDAGCDAHLSKPIRKQQLLATVASYAPQAKPDADAEAGKERVCIDAEIRDIVDGFLENRRRDIRALAEALTGQDYDTIQRLGHNMKGSGRGYGFNEISEIGAALDQAGKSHDLGTARQQVDRLTGYLDRIYVVFE